MPVRSRDAACVKARHTRGVDQSNDDLDQHPFARRPHRTLLFLSLPVVVSLIAEPLTGLADTAFVARLGAVPLAALGLSTTLLSSLFWVFNFLGIGTHTEVARYSGANEPMRARRAASTALWVSLAIGGLLTLAAWPWVDEAARFMGADDAMAPHAVVYLQIRLLGSAAVLIMLSGFGALRGLQDMKSPLYIAVASNGLNIALDPLMIFGAGPLPAMGVAGAAWASTASQWIAALWVVAVVRRKLGLAFELRTRDVARLFRIGRDLFVRTGLLTLFLLFATRSATRIGAEAGAAHQAIRQMWIFTAFLLDAYAAATQSLVGYFLGAQQVDLARRAAAVSVQWALGTGFALALLLGLGEDAVMALLVPAEARTVFASAWWVACLAQPLNALSFATDGIHWGASDYRFLRNAMLAATAASLGALQFVDLQAESALFSIWLITVAWIGIRALLGVARIWPGIGSAPLRPR